MRRPQTKAVPKHRSGVDPRHFTIREAEKWTYMDRSPHGWKAVNNRIVPYPSPKPHMILYDKTGTPRFVLRYEMEERGPIRIQSIQRERTQYEGEPPDHKWSAEKETAKSKEFQKHLGGVHPAEFLLSEFLTRHRDEIVRRMKDGNPGVVLSLRESSLHFKDLYGPLIDRFFGGRPIRKERDLREYELSPRKKRVKEILGI